MTEQIPATCPKISKVEIDCIDVWRLSNVTGNNPVTRIPNEMCGRLIDYMRELERDLAAARDEIERLKHPLGTNDRSDQQQARAWVAVWRELERAGMLSFVASDGRGETRAVEFIRHLSKQLASRDQTIADLRGLLKGSFRFVESPYMGHKLVRSWTDAEIDAALQQEPKR